MQMLALACIAIGGLVWYGQYSLSTMQDTIPLWNNSLMPSGGMPSLTSNFTLPNYTDAVLHVEWLLTFKYHYPDDQVSVQTVWRLDGVQIYNKPYSYSMSDVHEQSLNVTANVLHTVTLTLVIMVQGPAVSTWNITASGWVGYNPAVAPPPVQTYYTVSVASSVGGSTSPGSGLYQALDGSTFSVSGSANSGYTFSRFTLNGVNSTSSTLSFTVISNQTVVAYFMVGQTESPPPASPNNTQTNPYNPPSGSGGSPIQVVQSHADYVAYGLVFFGVLVLGVGVMQRKKRGS
jgi:hypothetical protein